MFLAMVFAVIDNVFVVLTVGRNLWSRVNIIGFNSLIRGNDNGFVVSTDVANSTCLAACRMQVTEILVLFCRNQEMSCTFGNVIDDVFCYRYLAFGFFGQ